MSGETGSARATVTEVRQMKIRLAVFLNAVADERKRRTTTTRGPDSAS